MTGGLFSYHKEIVRIKQKYHVRQQAEACLLYTSASYTEDENGTIEVGKNADFVVLEKNIYEIDPDEIKVTQVDMTVLGGEIVYEREVEE